jgi:hypothetical protein
MAEDYMQRESHGKSESLGKLRRKNVTLLDSSEVITTCTASGNMEWHGTVTWDRNKGKLEFLNKTECISLVHRTVALYSRGSNWMIRESSDRLCGLVVRVLGYKSGGPGSISGTTGKKK